MTLWRPVGLHELALVFDSGMRAFPPRRPEQPIFYPVLNFGYAAQIAREWNTTEPEAVGYVTQFEVADSYAQSYERHVVGGREHEELWIPAEQLAEFNEQIQGFVAVVAGYFGANFRGLIADKFGLKAKTAVEQFSVLTDWLAYSSFDVWCEIGANAKAVYLNYLFWRRGCAPESRQLTDLENKLIDFIEHRWSHLACGFPLPKHTESV